MTGVTLTSASKCEGEDDRETEGEVGAKVRTAQWVVVDVEGAPGVGEGDELDLHVELLHPRESQELNASINTENQDSQSMTSQECIQLKTDKF